MRSSLYFIVRISSRSFKVKMFCIICPFYFFRERIKTSKGATRKHNHFAMSREVDGELVKTVENNGFLFRFLRLSFMWLISCVCRSIVHRMLWSSWIILWLWERKNEQKSSCDRWWHSIILLKMVESDFQDVWSCFRIFNFFNPWIYDFFELLFFS